MITRSITIAAALIVSTTPTRSIPATATGLLRYRSDNEREAVATHDSDI
jgi:hypothetical protein